MEKQNEAKKEQKKFILKIIKVLVGTLFAILLTCLIIFIKNRGFLKEFIFIGIIILSVIWIICMVLHLPTTLRNLEQKGRYLNRVIRYKDRIELKKIRHNSCSSEMIALALLAGGIFVGLINFISKDISQNSFNPFNWEIPQIVLFVIIILILLTLLTMAIWRWGVMKHEIGGLYDLYKKINLNSSIILRRGHNE